MSFLSALTLVLLVGGSEWIARLLFRSSPTSAAQCMVLDDFIHGVRGRPNCVVWQKEVESRLVEYRFNSCGHRTGMECGPKPPGAYRIVLLGRSVSVGMNVPWERSFGALLPKNLSHRTGRNVELYNEGLPHTSAKQIALNFGEVTAVQPDLILWPVTKVDIENAEEIGGGSKKEMPLGPSMLEDKSRAIFALRYALFQIQTQYVKQYLTNKQASQFLQSNPGAAWRSSLMRFNHWAGELELQGEAAGIPLVATYIPERAQAAMLSMGSWPAGYDPYRLGRDVKAIVENHGATYVDILNRFRSIPHPERNYLPVDLHPNEQGHALLASLMADALIGINIPANPPGKSTPGCPCAKGNASGR